MRALPAALLAAGLGVGTPADAAEILLRNYEIELNGEIRRGDDEIFAIALGEWLAVTGRPVVELRLRNVRGDTRVARTIARHVVSHEERTGHVANVFTEDRVCTDACRIILRLETGEAAQDASVRPAAVGLVF
ncbi:MAG TPA: hypothetical protein VF342_07230 [Alphaproteobacteria bacterium]